MTVRLEPELLAELRLLAREENRSLTNLIETVLRQRLVGSGSVNASPAHKAPSARSANQTKDKPTHAR